MANTARTRPEDSHRRDRAAPSAPQKASEPGYPPIMPGAKADIYKIAGGIKLQVWMFTPEGHRESDRDPAIIFFFGGGWNGGNPIQFAKHCEYLAARGMVAMTADYRVRMRHGVKANVCVADAKSAIRWMRKQSAHLGIDPDRIVAGGGSSGGHLAAAAATLSSHDDPKNDRSISARPNALVLFNPALVLAPIPGQWEPTVDQPLNLDERLGASPESISPYHHIKSGVGPTVIFHGTADRIVPYKLAELFTEKMHTQGNRCELIGYQGAEHGFFNYGRDWNAPFIDTVNRMDAFLVSLGYLKGAPGTVRKA